jgi:hypothetical protein
VPANVPLKPGAEPSEFGDSEPYSGTYALAGSVQEVLDWELLALRQAGWAVATDDGPNEDGSRTIELGSRTVAACYAQLMVGPLGSLTAMRIRVSATCPFR